MKPKQQKLVAAVTGANGLIGCYLVKMLLEKGWFVKALTRSSSFSATENISIIKGDINDESALQDLLSGTDAIFHCAAELRDESKMYEVNVQGVKTLLSVLATSPTHYFCYISSAGVVGPTKERLVTEDTICHPHNEYERTKYEAERLILSSKFKGHICIIRPTNVIGRTKKGVLALPFRDSWKDRLMCFLKGKEGAHIVHVKDVVAASIFFYEVPILKPEIFLVSYDDEFNNTLSGVYELVLRCLGKGNKHCFISLPIIFPYLMRCALKGESLHGASRFSSQKIRNAGFSFHFDFERAVIDVCVQSKNDP